MGATGTVAVVISREGRVIEVEVEVEASPETPTLMTVSDEDIAAPEDILKSPVDALTDLGHLKELSKFTTD